MFDNICLICIHCDASLGMLQARVEQLYAPEVETVYVRISKRVNLFRRARMLKVIRKVFKSVELDVMSVSDRQIYLIAAFNDYIGKRRRHKGEKGRHHEIC